MKSSANVIMCQKGFVLIIIKQRLLKIIALLFSNYTYIILGKCKIIKGETRTLLAI